MAQNAPTVTGLEISLGNGWTLHPAFATTTDDLVGYLAEQVSGAPAPNGYSLLWLQRGPGDVFSMAGYTGSNIADAANTVESATSMSDLFIHASFAPTLYDPMYANDEPGAGLVAMSHGLALDDPQQAAAASMTPQEMEQAVQDGAKGATGMSADAITTSPCVSTNLLQNRLWSIIAQAESVISSEGQTVSELSVSPADGCCWPTLWWPITTTYNIFTGPWTLTTTGMVFPPARCAYSGATTPYTYTTTIDFWCNTTTTGPLIGPAGSGPPASRSCPANPSGFCPASPSC